ncbi:MAG TPA: dinitrogenase iron-molybdenum cofactor biosynthesis protein [Desulfobacteraceae bacterium]|nr:dinitrogenase iron-molybdenum cofactor biosynthesis protein [Desulfobacteraceae bacterium]
MELLIAFATDNGKKFNDDHFGMAKYYQIYRFYDDGEAFVEQRENVGFQEDEAKKHGDPAKAQATSSVLKGVDVLVSRKFGPNITRMVHKFVCVVVRTNAITDAIKIVKNHMDEVIKEKNKTKERRPLVFKK